MGNGARRTRRLATIVTLAAALVAAAGTTRSHALVSGAATPSSVSAPALAGKVTFTILLGRKGTGRFSARGVIVDSGQARSHHEVRANRVRVTLTLLGKAGRIKLVANQVCGKKTSAWTVYSGLRDYRGLTGKGKGSGAIPCKGRGPHRGVYAGVVRTPPPGAIALPGTYSGSGGNANFRMTFDVAPDGRAVTNVSFRQLVVRCDPDAVKFPAPKLTDRYPLGEDRKFSITTEGYTITGRISALGARGSVAYASGSCKAATVNWKATNPPRQLPLVAPGRYCGFTLGGSGVCIDATSDAWVTRTRFLVKLRCLSPQEATFDFEYVYEGALGIRPDLTFSGGLAKAPLPDGGSLRFSVSGKFDDVGGVTGKGGVSRVSIVRDGSSYSCRSAVAPFSAKLGA